MMRLTAVCVLAMAASPAAAEAQEPTSALEALIGTRELRRGVGVYVTDDAGQRIKGTVIDLSGASLTVETGEGAKSLKAGAIRRIELQDTIESGIWIGVGLATAGSYASCALESRAAGQFCYGTAYLYLPALGVSALVGAMLDASRHKTIYEASGTKRVTVAPSVSRGGLGLRASIEW